MELFSFKGYQGTIETSVADGVLFGKILFITDLVTYEAPTLGELKDEFEAAVNDYLSTCKEVGKRPDKPCSGQFNVRTGPELHKKALTKSLRDGTSLNAVVVDALSAYLSEQATAAQVSRVVFNVTLQQQETVYSTSSTELNYFSKKSSYGAASTTTH